MTCEDFRRLALDFPETVESSHMNHPDFRVRGKIFATIYPDNSWGMVKLTPEQQKRFVRAKPKVFTPVKGGWGRQGATQVRLRAASKTAVRHALVVAWRNVAPKRLAAQFDADRKGPSA
jgi:hypothetical protein